MLGHGSLLQRHYRWLMNVYRSPPRRSTAHMMINIHRLVSSAACRCPLCIHWDLHTLTPTSFPFAHKPSRRDAHPNVCVAAKVKVSRSRAMRRGGGRCDACWESGSLVMYSDPQLANTRLMLRSQQGGGACGIHGRFRRVLRLKRGEGVRDFSASSHEDWLPLYER